MGCRLALDKEICRCCARNFFNDDSEIAEKFGISNEDHEQIFEMLYEQHGAVYCPYCPDKGDEIPVSMETPLDCPFYLEQELKRQC